ncbi:LOW QUALITY PROTEIN: probable palmitoyltransferase ZDHHC24 [Nylanderia fulva]|uniref:LOW QUALITY PROTEIN: probable palmitoyltransferase ZDHHC24 n=1 Tax=Nylanderia fulva TaxID=613905 RepID=UPI0010FB8904|nr:LOW QUALITY PROTEIN: probable palmitoyltransferase ZDHHC24 [Nylanderia fulva]
MIVRKKIGPRTLGDLLSMVFVLIIVPLMYWFGLWIVLPALYRNDILPYSVHFVLGNFIMLNIVGNFTYTVLCDTSTKRCIVPVSTARAADGWRLCVICEGLSPPRSWHCNTCDVCILKRDHHCVFTGCCVGHHNHRYFVMFLWYLFLGAAYAFFYGSFFIWSRTAFEFPMSIVKMIFPVAIFFFGFDSSIDQFYLLLYVVSLVGTLYTGVLCIYHFNLILRGVVGNESNKKITYDMGWKDNVREVFGERWYLAWLLPYIKSQLPHDGVSWHNLCSKKD